MKMSEFKMRVRIPLPSKNEKTIPDKKKRAGLKRIKNLKTLWMQGKVS